MLPFLHTAAYLGIYLLIGVGISMLMGWAGLALVDWGIRIRKDKKSWFGMVLGWVVQLVGVYVIGRAGWILIDGALDFTPPDHAGLPVALGSGYVAAVIGWGLLNLLSGARCCISCGWWPRLSATLSGPGRYIESQIKPFESTLLKPLKASRRVTA